MSDGKRPAVLNGELQYTSVSAIQRFFSCPSSWWFRYVLGLPDHPPGKAQKRGIAGHKRIQTYLKGGPDVLDRLERTGKKFMPAPGADLFCDEPTQKVTAQDVPIRGFIDLLNPRRVSQGAVDVSDWKFKGELAKATRDEQLADPTHEAGVQMLGYGMDAILRYPEIERVRLAHGTFQTYGVVDSAESAIEVNVDRIREGWETVTSLALPGMRRAARAKSHVEVPKNETVCHKYRKPCPYISTCLDRMARLTHGFKFHSPSGDQKMGMLSEMTQGTPAATAPAAVPIHPKSAMTIRDESTGIKAKDAQQGGKYKVEGVDCQFLCCTAMGGVSYASFIPIVGGVPKLVSVELIVFPIALAQVPTPPAGAPLVLPPDAPQSVPALAAKPLVPIVPVLPPATVLTGTSVPAAAPEPVPTEPKRRGRPPKPPEAPAAAAAQPEPAAPIAAGGMDGVHLYFGCSPLGVLVQSLAPYVEQVDAVLRKEGQVTAPDIRTANDKTFGFSMWKGYLAKVALEMPPPAGHYRVTFGDEREEVIAKALAAIAKPGCAVFA